jgi:hypothetical protein
LICVITDSRREIQTRIPRDIFHGMPDIQHRKIEIYQTPHNMDNGEIDLHALLWLTAGLDRKAHPPGNQNRLRQGPSAVHPRRAEARLTEDGTGEKSTP